MKAGRLLAALVGFAGGAAVVVATLALELIARDLPVRGGLSELQMDSVAVWVLESLPFVLAVLFGANMSFLTPIGYQTNLLVMGAGGYRFSDFFRAGLPLQLLLWLVLSAALWWLYL